MALLICLWRTRTGRTRLPKLALAPFLAKGRGFRGVTQIINLTPHDCHLIMGDTTYTIKRSGLEARVSVNTFNPHTAPVAFEVGCAGFATYEQVDVPIAYRQLGTVQGLPGEQLGTLYLVSTMVADAVPHREDVIVPGELVRDEQGRPIGCRGFYRSGAGYL
jgi:hypothetical protein